MKFEVGTYVGPLRVIVGRMLPTAVCHVLPYMEIEGPRQYDPADKFEDIGVSLSGAYVRTNSVETMLRVDKSIDLAELDGKTIVMLRKPPDSESVEGLAFSNVHVAWVSELSLLGEASAPISFTYEIKVKLS